MVQVEDAFIERFGPYAGWAHNVLFISDLAASKQYLPASLQPGGRVKVKTEAPDVGSSEPAEEIRTVKTEGGSNPIHCRSRIL